MEINGKYYFDPDIQLRELKIAVERLPFDAALRPHFDFLFGYIAALQEEIMENDEALDKVSTLEEEIRGAKSAIQKVLNGHGVDCQYDDFEDCLEKLIKLADKKGEPVERELIAVRL